MSSTVKVYGSLTPCGESTVIYLSRRFALNNDLICFSAGLNRLSVRLVCRVGLAWSVGTRCPDSKVSQFTLHRTSTRLKSLSSITHGYGVPRSI